MFAVVDRGTARTPWEFSLGFGSSGATGALFPKNPKQPRCQHPVVRAPARAAPRRITLRSARQCRDASLDPITEFSARPRRNEPARAARAPTRSVTIDTASRLTRMLASSRGSRKRARWKFPNALWRDRPKVFLVLVSAARHRRSRSESFSRFH